MSLPNAFPGQPVQWVMLLFVLLQWPLSPDSARGQAQFAKSSAVDDAVRDEMQKQNLVGVAIGIIQDSQLVYTRGYGFSNLKSKTPVTATTVFNWASNSKPVIAVAAMQLVQQGQIDLDVPIETYISGLPLRLKSITTRQLLCHQSGIPHYLNGKIVPSGRKVTSVQELDPLNSVRRFQMSPLLFEPGLRTAYSSYAYVLLTAVVQEAGKEPIDQQLLARIAKPLGLTSFQLDVPFNNQPDWTTGYKLANGTPQEIPDYAHFWKHGAGGYKSNVTDFSRFAMALLNHELIDEATTDKMWTPQTTSDGAPSQYGLGVVISGSGNTFKVSHDGSQEEARTRMVLYPNRRNGVVVMCNTHDCEPGRISTAIYSALNQ